MASNLVRRLADKFGDPDERTLGALLLAPAFVLLALIGLGFQTRNFTKEQASEFVEWLHSWGANNGITFEEKL